MQSALALLAAKRQQQSVIKNSLENLKRFVLRIVGLSLLSLLYVMSLAQHSEIFTQIDKQKGLYGMAIGHELDSIYRFERSNLNSTLKIKEKYITRKFTSLDSAYGIFFGLQVSKLEIYTDGRNVINELKFHFGHEQSHPQDDSYYLKMEAILGKPDSYLCISNNKDSLQFKNEYLWIGKKIYINFHSEYIFEEDSSIIFLSIMDRKRIAKKSEIFRFK